MTFEKKKVIIVKTSNIVFMYSNSLARHFSHMFHTKCLLPRLLPVRSCLKYFYQCSLWNFGKWPTIQAHERKWITFKGQTINVLSPLECSLNIRTIVRQCNETKQDGLCFNVQGIVSRCIRRKLSRWSLVLKTYMIVQR